MFYIQYLIFRVKCLPCFGVTWLLSFSVTVPGSLSLLCHFPEGSTGVWLHPIPGRVREPPGPKPCSSHVTPVSASKHKFLPEPSPGPAGLSNGCWFKICGIGANSAPIPKLLHPQESIKPTKMRIKPQEFWKRLQSCILGFGCS